MKIADLTEARKIVVPQVDTGGLTLADVRKVWGKEWRESGRRPREEDFRAEFILATMAGSYNEMYRGICVPPNWVKALKPGMPVGRFWSDETETANWFASGAGECAYDERFKVPGSDTDRISIVLVGAASLESIDLLNTIGARICWQMETKSALSRALRSNCMTS